MKTIEEKLSDYLDSKSGDSLESPINALSVGFKDGYNEALRWRDPEKELPDLGVQVQVKVEDTYGGDMKVYISGQITGLPFEEVERDFNEAEQRLEEEGFTAVNPLSNGLTVDHEWVEHMKADIKMLLECDAIYLLKNWNESKGATIERDLAVSLGYDVIEQKKIRREEL